MSLFDRIYGETIEYARKAHKGQTRKYSGLPYITHPISVGETLFDAGADQAVVQAGILHDVVEDTDLTIHDIAKDFGSAVAGLVLEVTDVYTKEAYPEWNRARRKAAEADRLAGVSTDAKAIKMADCADNSASILLHDPRFAKKYLAEMAYLVGRIADEI